MPSLPSKISRRKHVTPIAIRNENDVWHRSFKLMGLEPVHSSGSFAVDTMSSAEAVSAPALLADGIKPPPRKLTLMDLPAEIHRDIFKWSSSTDLIALSLVSKRFRDVAAAQLYRNFHIVFPDEDDPSYESPIDGLAGGLDTFVTSEYDYSRYLKEIVLDTLSGGNKGERAYRHYTYDLSCGKFMNTLFLLTLRKAKALETFKWDLRVELSRPVFRALHQISSLQNLHVRMQAGPSIYEIPPPLPSLASSTSESSTNSSPLPNQHTFWKYSSTNKYKSKASTITPPSKEPPTFSGFKNLKSLAVLDMDTLDYVAEIKACIRESSSTLGKLKLSFSENLARQARKPLPADDTGTESDNDIDEFGNMITTAPAPPLPSSNDDPAGPAKALRVQEEKKAQDAVLGRIFGVESVSAKKIDGGSSSGSEEEEKPDDEYDNAGKNFIKDLTNLSKKLVIAINGSAPRTQQQKEALEVIEKAARKYVESSREEAKEKAGKKAAEASANASDPKGSEKPALEAPDATGVEAKGGDSAPEKPEDADEAEKAPQLFGDSANKTKKNKEGPVDGPNPDDINVEEPETEWDLKEFEEVTSPEVKSRGHDASVGTTPQSSPKKKTMVDAPSDEVKALIKAELEAAKEKYDSLKSKFGLFMDEAEVLKKQAETERAGSETGESLIETQMKMAELVTKMDTARAQMEIALSQLTDIEQRVKQWSQGVSKDKASQMMNEYIRNTRGLALKTLAIYLIPIKASVLSKALDIHVLKRITLLNVGSQVPFWNLLAKENKAFPLPLRKIHTDNVSAQFVTFVAQLETLTELFMLERSSKVPEYSFASKTTVKMEHIRKFILKKHTETLKKLLIKNENDCTWDVNETVIKLLCKKGKQLEELGVSFGVRTVHTFNQYLPGLVKLRAMHIINFRNDDTCHWVIREIRKFAIDSVSHNPEMKLEYIAVDNTVERIVRRAKKPKTKGKEKAVDKGKSKHLSLTSSAFPTIETIITPISDLDASDESSEESDDDLGPGLKLETLEGVRFYDIYGIRMWRKDVILGRL